MGTLENNYIDLKVLRNCVITSKISSSVSFHQHFQWFPHMNDFVFDRYEKIFKTVAHKFVIWCKQSSFCLLVTRKPSGGFLPKCFWVLTEQPKIIWIIIFLKDLHLVMQLISKVYGTSLTGLTAIASSIMKSSSAWLLSYIFTFHGNFFLAVFGYLYLQTVAQDFNHSYWNVL